MRSPLKRSTLHTGTIILVIAEYLLYAFIVVPTMKYPYSPNFWEHMFTSLGTFFIAVSSRMHFHWQYRSDSPEKATFLRWFIFLFFLATHLYPSYFVSRGFLTLGYWWELAIPIVKVSLILLTWDKNRFLTA